MNLVVAYALLAASIFCSFKLAKEKQQNHIAWVAGTVLLGPGVFIIQYLSTVIAKSKKMA